MATAALVSPLARVSLESRHDSKASPASKAASKRFAVPEKPFRFLDLPPEIRSTIYELTLFAKLGKHIKIRKRRKGLAPRLALFFVSYQLYSEASYVFYTSQVFRMFYVQDFQPLPTVRDLARRNRKLVTSIELILGPGWTNPPKDWRVTPRLGLQDLVRVQTLQVFVELDPSHPSLAGYRVSEDYYTNFAGKLLRDILTTMPSVKYVQLDTNPSVQPTGPLMTRLLQETAAAKCLVKWGPGPRGRAADNVFVELLSKVEPWLKPKFPGRPDSDLPYLTVDEHGNYILSTPAPRAADAVNDEQEDDEEDDVDVDEDKAAVDDHGIGASGEIAATSSQQASHLVDGDQHLSDQVIGVR